MSYQLIENRIVEIISPSMDSMGYEIVRVKLVDGGRKTLQIMAERKRDKDLGIDDCTRISRAISAILDVEDPIYEEYNLEVSSPGIDRPLIKPDDFRNYAGKLVKLTTSFPVEGRKRFKGILNGISEDDSKVSIKLEDLAENTEIDFTNINSAKLVITDELLKEKQKQRVN